MNDKFLANKYSFILLFFFSAALILSGCSHSNNHELSASTYRVIKADVSKSHNLVIDGNLNDAAWTDVKTLNKPLFYPWNSEKAPLTNFKAMWDEDYFYFAFSAQDRDILLIDTIVDEIDIGQEDRVEIFFASLAPKQSKLKQAAFAEAADLQRYYGVEIDAKGRVLDFSAQYYRQFDFNWDMPSLVTAAQHDDKGYQVEGRISLQALRNLQLLSQNNDLHVGVFRGQYSQTPSGVITRWMSWLDPKTSQPDFHVSKAFGRFLLVGSVSMPLNQHVHSNKENR